jgi:hypothetical protein
MKSFSDMLRLSLNAHLHAITAHDEPTLSVRLGNYRVSASLADGTPTHLTPEAIMLASAMAMLAHTGSVQSGSTTITITPWEDSTPN